MDRLILIELLATATSLCYLFLLIKENVWCWAFSIVSGLLSIHLFLESKLYSESILYVYFILISLYGWWNWSSPRKQLKITTLPPGYHLFAVLIGVTLSVALGYCFESNTDANQPYLDAFTTIFSVIASILEARKILSGWIYWVIINGATVGLYFSKSLDIYAAVMVIYFIMSIVGYWEWRRVYKHGS